MNAVQPTVICATGAPMLGDAIRAYLKGFYAIVTVSPGGGQNGLKALDQALAERRVDVVIVDESFPHDPVRVANRAKAHQPKVGLIYIAHDLNIFKVLRCLDGGYVAYLYLGDPLADSLKQVADNARRGQRYLSPTIKSLHERYTMYRGLFMSLPEALAFTFKLMGEGLSAPDIVRRIGLKIS